MHIASRLVTEITELDLFFTMGANFRTSVRPTTRYHVDTTVQAWEDRINDLGFRILWEQT
jgi:hypothetical protein